MAVFPRLADPGSYVACLQDLHADPVSRDYWLKRFARHVAILHGLPQDGGSLEQAEAWPAFEADYLNGLDRLRREPWSARELTVLSLCEYRSRVLRRHGLGDPFSALKADENAQALAGLPARLAELDGRADHERPAELLRGLLAANVADFGSVEALERYRAGGWNLSDDCARLPRRPWRFDDLDAMIAGLDEAAARGRRVVVFVDNAGPEFVLGVLPLARELAGRGAHVTLAANSGPALNDVTDAEARRVLALAVARDGRLAALADAGRIEVVDSGCAEPLLDLRHVSVHCAERARDAGLVVLIGMGRSIETNFDAAMTCDCARLALVKDEMVARLLRVPLFAPCCRWTAAGEAPSALRA
jgi:type II pantothenate kinase